MHLSQGQCKESQQLHFVLFFWHIFLYVYVVFSAECGDGENQGFQSGQPGG